MPGPRCIKFLAVGLLAAGALWAVPSPAAAHGDEGWSRKHYGDWGYDRRWERDRWGHDDWRRRHHGQRHYPPPAVVIAPPPPVIYAPPPRMMYGPPPVIIYGPPPSRHW